MKVCLIHLGCSKNLVDSEEMLGALAGAGYELEPEPENADIIVVNTCGFIESAKQESIDAIIKAIGHKNGGRCISVVVAGCLSQRYGEELKKELPEVDVFTGVGRNEELPVMIEKAINGAKIIDCSAPGTGWIKSNTRIRSTAPWTAYLRIADGCSNRCSYCAIPDIRGPFRSRPPELILAEAENMAREGVIEVNLIAQDVTRYGEDLSGWTLARLLKEIAGFDGLKWIRLLYCYPTRITDELIEIVASEPKVIKYMDIPLQHGDDKMLGAMNRQGNREQYLEVINKLRKACPEIALRTSLIVGFPGEGKKEFESLLSFVEEINFDRIGAFVYSREDGTPAASMQAQVRWDIAQRRYGRLMQTAGRISLEKNRRLIGQDMEVLVESEDFGRSYRDAPEIDGIVRLKGKRVEPGQLVRAEIVETDDYDVTAIVH